MYVVVLLNPKFDWSVKICIIVGGLIIEFDNESLVFVTHRYANVVLRSKAAFVDRS